MVSQVLINQSVLHLDALEKSFKIWIFFATKENLSKFSWTLTVPTP